MKRSLNEVEQVSRKAAKGCGLPWGIADEAGKAVRWLHALKLNGCGSLMRLMAELDHCHLPDYSPYCDQGVWQAPSGVLSPLLVGPGLCDRLLYLDSTNFKTGKIARPLLLAGFIGQATLTINQSVQIGWHDMNLYLWCGGLAVSGRSESLDSEWADNICCRQASLPDELELKLSTSGETDVNPDDWQILENYAHMSYVEATAESRISGAGAGLTDND